VSFVSFTAAHGHSHDGVHHAHSHDHHEEVNPSFKYSKQANEKVKQNPEYDPHTHHHGHSHDEVRAKRYAEPPKPKEAPTGY
jgi:hypothetical protein